MKNHFAVTVTDFSGSHHFTIRKSVKKYLLWVPLLAVSIIAGSVAYNYTQYRQARALHIDSEALTEYKELMQAVSHELVRIEQLSGVETGEGYASLDERIHTIGQFYTEKEDRYSEIGHRVKEIEQMLDPRGGVAKETDHNLAERVELAAISVRQEKFMLRNIPSGMPMNSTVVTSKFGNRIHPVTRVKSFHKGIDLRAKRRQNIYATADGIVSAANYSKLSGNRVIVRHNFGFQSYYAHLHKMNVRPGDVVHKGDLVGISGNTGRSNGPHLHYEIRYLGKAIDPSAFLKWEFGTDEIFTQVKEIQWPSLVNLINKQIMPPTLQLSQLEPTLPERSR